eukprot:2468031-Amphidinium_carterae.1
MATDDSGSAQQVLDAKLALVFGWSHNNKVPVEYHVHPPIWDGMHMTAKDVALMLNAKTPPPMSYKLAR